MPSEPPVSLAVVRAKQEDPHVIVQIEAWHLGGGRWYFEPETRSRMGDLTPAGWDVVGNMCREYGGNLVAHGEVRKRERGGRRLRNRVRRGWR